jgi:hypothetical protein
MRRSAAVLGAVAVAVLMVAGCSSSGSSDSSGSKSATTLAPALTTAQLQSMLLTPTDLGTTWTEDTSSTDNSSTSPSCMKGLTGSGSSAGATAEAQYKSGETVFAYEGLGAAGSASEAQTAYQKVTTALDGCKDLTFTSDGQPVPATISSTGSAGVGDQSAGYTMAFTASGIPVTLDLVVAQVGSVDLIVMYGYAGGTPAGNVTQLATAAVDKVNSSNQA